ncbi:MAG: DoxX family protein [Sphingobium sp.]
MRGNPVRPLSEARPRKWARLLLAGAYAFAGVAHLARPAGFVAITPEWVPAPETVVALTGIAELAGAAGLMVPRLRPAAGVGLALYALCVWPANINHAVNGITLGGVQLGWAYHAPRLALQPLIIWWALWASGAIDWPFRRRPA